MTVVESCRAAGFPIAITKFCTPDRTGLFDKHLECLEKTRVKRDTIGGTFRDTPMQIKVSHLAVSLNNVLSTR